jgi:hypothetical protein
LPRFALFQGYTDTAPVFEGQDSLDSSVYVLDIVQQTFD